MELPGLSLITIATKGLGTRFSTVLYAAGRTMSSQVVLDALIVLSNRLSTPLFQILHFDFFFLSRPSSSRFKRSGNTNTNVSPPLFPAQLKYTPAMSKSNSPQSPSSFLAGSPTSPARQDPVLDILQDRLYNWLNGPTTLNDREISSLVSKYTVRPTLMESKHTHIQTPPTLTINR